LATVTTTNLIDDLDGSTADITVAFTVDTKRYRVDLSKANYDEYVAPLVKASRPSKVGRPPKQTASNGRRVGKTSSKTTAYSRLSAKEQSAIRSYLKRTRGRVADAEVSEWRSAGKP
jgi:Lsr2